MYKATTERWSTLDRDVLFNSQAVDIKKKGSVRLKLRSLLKKSEYISLRSLGLWQSGC